MDMITPVVYHATIVFSMQWCPRAYSIIKLFPISGLLPKHPDYIPINRDFCLLSRFLFNLSRLYPDFVPILSIDFINKLSQLYHNISIILILSRFYPDFWILRDLDGISVAKGGVP
jgi:hypothetical protein